MISCLGAPTRHLLMPRDPFQLSSVVTSQYSKIFFLEKVSGKSPESFPESLPIWVNNFYFCTVYTRDNHAEGMVFRKRLDTGKTFSGGERASKSILKTYLGNLEKNIFCTEIYDFVVIFS